jgi:SAM-dependent methyltransferase
MADRSSNKILNRVYNMTGDVDECRDVYREWAKFYEKDTVAEMGYIAPQVVADKLEQISEPTATVLDAGCGTGLAGAALRQRGFTTVDGMDLSPEMLAIAEEKEIYRDLRVQDLKGALSYADGSYDAITCVGIFTHAHVGPKGFNELLRVTRSGGSIVATVHEDVWGDGYEDAFNSFQQSGLATVASIEDAPYHLHGCKLCVLERAA